MCSNSFIPRIRKLNWISTEQLDINLNERDKEVRELMWSSINGKSVVNMSYNLSMSMKASITNVVWFCI